MTRLNVISSQFLRACSLIRSENCGMETPEANPPLPPLSPSRAKQGSPKFNSTLKATVFRSAQNYNTNQLKREIRRIDPRINALEEQVVRLRQDIPIGLNEIMDQLSLNGLAKELYKAY